MDSYKRAALRAFGECYYCDYLTCYKTKKNYQKKKQGRPCQIRRQELKSKSMKSSIRQKMKKGLDI